MSLAKQTIKSLQEISEAYISIPNKEDLDSIKKLENLNKLRIGDTMLNINGVEVPNSVVLSPLTYALKSEDGIYTIETYSKLKGVSHQIEFTGKEAKILKNIL